MSAPSIYDLEKQDSAILHASCVAVGGRGLLIVGASGAGKSELVLQMMALGAELVGDDRVALRNNGGEVTADAAQNIRGVIEARGIGLLRAPPVGPVGLRYVVDMDQREEVRLPDPISIRALGQTVPLLRGRGVPNLASALMQLMKMGRVNPEWPSK
ncbi:HPr kinase/phosphorylase [Ruegeria atlantica]|uniref:HPr kinase/phosphorylase n=1 Tax=Ruegeria atlantica TaxID=81569 RepID=A0A0P1EGV7_9RHOB|nr:HPr kinase/phosphatase C-terminal domain-containing protein [Ruegeria atlantica]CUH49520.1 HPr kinase/phosphorylase [Ruegeria atlantica]